MRTLALGMAVLAVSACALKTSTQPQGEKLYFALEVRREGKLVAKPKLLGEAGKPLRAERRQPGAALPDYRLSLHPVDRGGRYDLVLDLSLPEMTGHSELAILHGEERKLELGGREGELQVSLLLMKVDSPEFRALMQLAQSPSSSAI
jgi:hypothetical protein